jgi:hypothetical protein
MATLLAIEGDRMNKSNKVRLITKLLPMLELSMRCLASCVRLWFGVILLWLIDNRAHRTQRCIFTFDHSTFQLNLHISIEPPCGML